MTLTQESVPRRWIQVDYDIPEKEPEARQKLVDTFLGMGGRRLTMSVYHCPYSDEVYKALLDVSKIPGAKIHVVRPEYEIVDAKGMYQRYIDDVVQTINHAEEVAKEVDKKVADGEMKPEAGVSRMRTMIDALDLCDSAAQRVGRDELIMQLKEVRALCVQIKHSLMKRPDLAKE